MMMFNPGASVRVNFPKRSMVQSYPCGTVLMPANSVKTTSSTSTMAKISKPFMKNLPRAKMPAAQRAVPQPYVRHCSAANPHWSPIGDVRFDAPKSQRSDPALKFAQHQLTDHVHAGVAVVQAGDCRELLAAIVPEDLGVLLRDFFQGFQAIGGEPGRDDGDAAHAVLGELGDGLVGVGLQPLVEAETRLKCQDQLRRLKAHALSQTLGGCDALRLIGVALVDVFLRHAVKRGHDPFGLERQGR